MQNSDQNHRYDGQRANNVPKEEALMIWGLEKSYDSLKSHSATDVSELAFKYYGEI
jgi:hypothetical protein